MVVYKSRRTCFATSSLLTKINKNLNQYFYIQIWLNQSICLHIFGCFLPNRSTLVLNIEQKCYPLQRPNHDTVKQ